jgi:hypothetical protein
MYDKDEDGFIDKNDMFALMKLMIGNELSDAQISEIVEKTLQDLDEDKDGKLSFEEFSKVNHTFLVYNYRVCRLHYQEKCNKVSMSIEKKKLKSINKIY